MKVPNISRLQAKPSQARIVDSQQVNIDDAVALLRRGEILGIPTETVYGLGADATNGLACAKIFEAKGRPTFNPLIAHCTGLDMARRYGQFTVLADRLAEAFWPGPLTLIVKRASDCAVADLVTAGLDTIAIRVPAAPVMHDLIAALGAPIAAPSANRSGHVSGTDAQAVADDLGHATALIIDSGPSPVGLESTIIDASGDHPILLRPGGLPRDRIEDVLGAPLHSAPRQVDADRPIAPGMLASHYAPSCPVRMNAETHEENEGWLAFGDVDTGSVRKYGTTNIVNLSPKGDLREAAANLFAGLRELDAAGVTAIAVSRIPDVGLGEAINDRLRRAAIGRDIRT